MKHIEPATALRELRSLVATYLEGSDDAQRATELLDALEAPASTEQKSFAIEFRSGSYFQSLTAMHGCTVERARRWLTRDEAESFMNQHEWIVFNGGMVVEVSR